MKILKLIVLINYTNEEVFGSTNINSYVGGWSMLYTTALTHFILFVFKLNTLLDLVHSKLFLISFFIVLFGLPLFIMIFLFNNNWTQKYYNEIFAMKMTKNKMWVYSLIYMFTPIVYFCSVYLLRNVIW
jgi:hypothetical protein